MTWLILVSSWCQKTDLVCNAVIHFRKYFHARQRLPKVMWMNCTKSRCIAVSCWSGGREEQR